MINFGKTRVSTHNKPYTAEFIEFIPNQLTVQ